jgi:hypothetical protein
MRKIFISYRRDDADEAAGRLSDHLVNQFGQDSVFMDVDGIAPGRDFRKVIEETLTQCDVLLGVMGRNWLDIKDETGKRRLENEYDFVRLEIASALRRDIPVIPVRVQGATVPKPDSLPSDLKDFSYRNAVELTHERWNSDVQVLVEKMRRLFSDPTCPPPGQPAAHAVQPPPVNQQQRVVPVAPAPVAQTPQYAAPVSDLDRRNRTRKIIKWSLVTLFTLSTLSLLAQGDANGVLGGLILVPFLIWDPFKWFVVKS